MPDQPTAPSLLNDGCDQALPRGSITRQFDFGQFVILTTDVADPATGRKVRTPLVINDSVRSVPVSASARGSESSGPGRLAALNAVAGGLPLHLALSVNDAEGIRRMLADPPAEVTVTTGAQKLLEHGALELAGGERFAVDLSGAEVAALLSGSRLEILAQPVGRGAPRAVAVQVDSAEAVVDEDATARALADGVVAVGGRDVAVSLTRTSAAALALGQSTAAYGADGGVIRFAPDPATGPSAVEGTGYVIDDVAAFLWERRVVRPDGSSGQATLDADAIRELRRDGVATVRLDGAPVSVATRQALATPALAPRLSRAAGLLSPGTTLPDAADRALSMSGARGAAVALTGVPGGAGADDARALALAALHALAAAGGSATKIDASTLLGRAGVHDLTAGLTIAPPEPRGLPVALMLAWRQLWTLDGFTRGELLQTIALAPGEETTVETFSWDRRTSRLDQSTETDVTMSAEVTDTTKDTDDVVKEMTRSNDFEWNVGGTVDASYKTLVASVDVHADAGTTTNDALKDVLKSTTTSLKERTVKAGTEIRTRRSTRITETTEVGSESRVTRRIRNANQCHTLTLSFYEVLAHYTVRLSYLPKRLRLVVMVPNPFAASVATFSTAHVRTNETALRRSLLDPALAEGFAAVRRLEAYAFARRDLEERAAQAQRAAGALAATKQATAGARDKPANPVEAELQAALASVAKAASALRDPASVDPAVATVLTTFETGFRIPGAGGGLGDAMKALAARARSGGLTQADVFLLAFGLIAEGRLLELAPLVTAWLFRTLLAAVPGGPALLSALDALAASQSPTAEDAVALVSLVPTGTAGPSGCGSALSPTDEQVTKVYDEVFKTRGGSFPWNYAERFRGRGLWQPDDAGVLAALGRLQKAVAQYASRQSAPPLAGDVADATQEHAAASIMDRLEFAFPLEEMATARERQDALLRHLDEHADYYRYVLFQNLPPSSQLDHIMANSGDLLSVGMFEPHAVGFQRDRLAIPISPTGESALTALHARLGTVLAQANQEAEATAAAAQETALSLVLPTPGVTVESSLGTCSSCEDDVVQERRISRDLLQAEVDRRHKRLEAGELGSFDSGE